MAAHSSVLAWAIPWTEKLGRLQFVGSQKNQTHLVIERAEIFTEVCFSRKFFQIVFLVLKNLLQVN